MSFHDQLHPLHDCLEGLLSVGLLPPAECPQAAATGWHPKVLRRRQMPRLPSPPTTTTAKQPNNKQSSSPRTRLTERQSCYRVKVGADKKRRRIKKDLAARRNPGSTTPRSIIPHSPNPVSSNLRLLRSTSSSTSPSTSVSTYSSTSLSSSMSTFSFTPLSTIISTSNNNTQSINLAYQILLCSSKHLSLSRD